MRLEIPILKQKRKWQTRLFTLRNFLYVHEFWCMCWTGYKRLKGIFDIIVVHKEYETYRENEIVGMYGIIQSGENETVNGM